MKGNLSDAWKNPLLYSSENLGKTNAQISFTSESMPGNRSNSLAIEVTTTLVRENYDFLSQWLLLEETGLTNPPVLMRGNFLEELSEQ